MEGAGIGSTLLACLLLGMQPGLAQTSAEGPKAAMPTLAQVLAASGISVSGYLDVSWQHLTGTGMFANGSPDRVFDAHPDALTVHQLAVNIGHQPKEGLGALLSLVAGEDADVFAPYDINPGAHSKFDFPQAYVQYATGPLTVIVGRYVTLAGFETIDPRTDSNVSRSIIYGYAIPFAHTGIRATLVAGRAWTFTAGVVNGWDDLRDTNSAKTAEFGVTCAPVKAVSLTVDAYLGKERVGGLTAVGPEGQRTLIDGIATWNVTDAMALVVNYDQGRQNGGAAGGGPARWSGLAGYLNFAFNDQWRASLRSEYLDDQDAYRTGLRQSWKATTLTLAWAASKSLDLRAEGRRDRSDHALFATTGAYFTSRGDARVLADHQGSVALEAVYTF